jgi:hypothetical protein
MLYCPTSEIYTIVPAVPSVSINASLLVWFELRGADVAVTGGGLVSIDSVLPLLSAGLLTAGSLDSIPP